MSETRPSSRRDLDEPLVSGETSIRLDPISKAAFVVYILVEAIVIAIFVWKMLGSE